jgi:hypothetical protein
MSSPRRPLPALSAAVLLCVVPTPGTSQSHAELVWNQLQTLHTTLVKEGYGVTRYLAGVLNNDRADTWTFQFTAGRTYRIIGACDADCRDIDLEVTGLDGKVIVKDTADDDLPVVTFDVTGTGDLKVKVSMYRCAEAPCFWGLGIWSKAR